MAVEPAVGHLKEPHSGHEARAAGLDRIAACPARMVLPCSGPPRDALIQQMSKRPAVRGRRPQAPAAIPHQWSRATQAKQSQATPAASRNARPLGPLTHCENAVALNRSALDIRASHPGCASIAFS
ncbi:hypothetical protein ASG91_13015 [Phycicoccus sp. Soil802]|nr:hypothetical protein ASG91_13015 [Phycicoccus sp. Soil802]